MATRVIAEAADDPFFRRVVSLATGLAFGGMLATLAVFERGTHGKLSFHWHWAAVPLLLVGLGLGVQFWRILWQAQKEGSPQATSRLRRFTIVLAFIALGSFLYPMRYIQSAQRQDVFIGLGLAVMALSAIGWFIWKTIQWVNANEPAEGETDSPADS